MYRLSLLSLKKYYEVYKLDDVFKLSLRALGFQLKNYLDNT